MQSQHQGSWHQAQVHNDGYERQAKRQKVKLACRECRDRKIRCDGGRPVCESCIRKKLPDRCVYALPEFDSESNVTALQDRVQELESKLSVFTDSAFALDPNSSNPASDISPGRQGFRDRRQRDSVSRFQGDGLRGSSISTSISPPATGATFSGRIAQPTLVSTGSRSIPPNVVEPQQTGVTAIQDNSNGQNSDPDSGSDDSPAFLGSSSAVGFMTEVYQTFKPANENTIRNDETHEHFSPGGTNLAPLSWFGYSGKVDYSTSLMLPDLVIPPRDTADSLLESYLLGAYQLQPFIYRPSFMKRYNRLWKSNSHSTPRSAQEKFDRTVHSQQLFHCKLNLAFALGCRYRSLSSQQQDPMLEKMQKTFAARATGLLSLEIMDTGSIELVQALLLMVQYLQTKTLSDRCWVVLGMAIRVAQSIALYLDVEGESQAQREERRRTWSYCILLDRVQSMTFGRPLMLVNPVLDPLPQIVDDEYWTTDPAAADGVQPADVLAKSAYFISVVKLSTITAEILRMVYSPIAKPSKNDPTIHDFDSLLKLDSDLSNWQKSLPPHVRFHHEFDSSNPNDLFLRHSHLLHHRFLNTRILLFRRLLVQVAAGHFGKDSLANVSALQETLARSCVGICTSAAQELVDVIKPNIGTWLIPPAWFTIFLIYISGTVLAVVFLIPPLHMTFTPEQKEDLHRSFNTCIECLRKYEELGLPSASKCLQTLQKMHASIEAGRIHSPAATAPPPRPQASEGPIQSAAAEATPAPWTSHYHSQINVQAGFGEEDGGLFNAPESWWLNDDIEWLIDLPGFNQQPY